MRYQTKKILYYITVILIIAFAVFGMISMVRILLSRIKGEDTPSPFTIPDPEFSVELLSINEFSRPGIERNEVNKIVVHYTANPGSTAEQNRNYFEGLKDSHLTSASSHFIVGLTGEVIQCIPTAEVAYGVGGEDNFNTISIEVCHNDEDGRFNQETYDSLIEVCAWLCGKFDLNADDVIRHYDITGKNCPKYYVEHEDEWKGFINDIKDYIKQHGEPKN